MEKSLAQTNLDIFNGKDPGRVLWQPRIDFWYRVNHKRGTLPAHLKNASLMEVYDYCHASVRYFSFPLKRRYKNVSIQEKWEDEKTLRRIWQTPVGNLSEALHTDDYQLSRYHSEYPLKTPADFKIFEYILQDEEWYWDEEQFQRELKNCAGRGASMYYARRSPIQSLFIESMGFEHTIFMLYDQPEVIERYIEVHDHADDAMYKVICQHPETLFNLGENIDFHMDSPLIWRKYLLPYYRKRVAQIHAAGIHTSIHIDGYMKRLLSDIPDCPTEAIEACTPLPQGDVTLEEIKLALTPRDAAQPTRILMDGIPAIFFLPSYSLEDLKACTEKVVELFHPRLILGASDEVPPDSDIERVRMVGEWVQAMV